MRTSLLAARRAAVAALLVLGPSAAMAQSQPISQSMAECGGLMLAASEIMSDPVRRSQLADRAQGWATAGIEQARAEGYLYPDFFIEHSFRTAFEEWRGNGQLDIGSEDFRDWTQYCRSLADARGLDLYQG